MTDYEICLVGGIYSHPGSQARRCAGGCGGLAYFMPSSLRQAAGKKVRYVCFLCVKPTEFEDVKPMTDEQIAELHSMGVDETPEQIQNILQRQIVPFLRRRRK